MRQPGKMLIAPVIYRLTQCLLIASDVFCRGLPTAFREEPGISILSGSRTVLSVPWTDIDFAGFANFPSFSRGIYSGVKNFVGVRLMRTSKLCLEPKYISNFKYSGYDILISDCYGLGLGEFVRLLNEQHAEFKKHGG